MQFINMRELSRSPSKYVKLAHADNDIVITKNGHPYAVLLKITDEEIEDFILAKHYRLEEEFDAAKQEYSSGKTISAANLLREVKKELSNEI